MFEHMGAALKVARALRGWSQQEVADRAGLKAGQVSRYEQGRVTPQLPQLERLLEGLEVGLPEFLFILLEMRRILGVMDARRELPAESLVRDAMAAHWTGMTDLQLRLGRAVEEVLRKELEEVRGAEPEG